MSLGRDRFGGTRILRAMALFRLRDPGDLVAPVLAAGFDGWVDAGQAATLALGQVAEGGRVVATFDDDQLYDYRARRPQLDILDGRLVEITWPELALRHVRVGGRDVLVLSGPEPDDAWRALAEDIVDLVRRLEVAAWVSIGAIPAAVAHTRPVPVLGTASGPGLLPAGVVQGPAGRLRVPSAALSAIELEVMRSGVPTVGFFAQIPHYVSGAYPAASLELLRHLGLYLGVELPSGPLASHAREQRVLLDSATSADERTRTYVTRLEEMTDEARLPEGDELISDIERFLRERGRQDAGGS
jgi:hypothetical protein